jgi:uncharacterized protein
MSRARCAARSSPWRRPRTARRRYRPEAAPAARGSLARLRPVLYLSRRAPAIEGHEICRVIEIPSPCIGVCRLDPISGLCAGCMRTLDEIALWPTADEAERLAIVQRLRARRRAAGRTSVADSRPRRRRGGLGPD